MSKNSDYQQRHQKIIDKFGLRKIAQTENEKQRYSLFPIVVALCVIAALTAAGFYFADKIRKHELSIEIQKKEYENEKIRKRRAEVKYAKIAFLEAYPEGTRIRMDGEDIYAKLEDGSTTPFRASKQAWIRYLPVNQDTVIEFSFSANAFEAYRTAMHYYDWFQCNDGDIGFEKIYRSVRLIPKTNELLSYCAKLAEVDTKYATACRVTRFEEAVTRTIYAQRTAEITDNASFRSVLDGTIRITTDRDDTKIFLNDEPLVVVNDRDEFKQVRLKAGEKYELSTYGKDKKIDISKIWRLKFETPNHPPHIVEILPPQWECTPVSEDEAKSSAVPPFYDPAQPLLQHLCVYHTDIEVPFEKIKAFFERYKQNTEPRVD